MLDKSAVRVVAAPGASIRTATPDDPYLTRASVLLHERLGYRQVGIFHDCGFKFGRWYSMTWMEKMLGPHVPDPAPFTPFPKIDG